MSAANADKLLTELIAVLRRHEHENDLTDVEIVGVLTYLQAHKVRCSFDAHEIDEEEDD